MARHTRIAAAPPHLGPERNDGDIFGEARVALDRHPDIPSAVHVHVAGAVATLTGGVATPGQYALAEETVRRVKGVRQVVNRITLTRAINPQGVEPPDTR